jgi:phospholipid/cholesterol/gamma-HCH transport system permease protein
MSQNEENRRKKHLFRFIYYFLDTYILELGRVALFFVESISWWLRRPFRFKELLQHLEFVGNKSLLIIFLTGLFTGLVFAFQAWVGLSIVNADNLIGPMTGLAVARELGPVLTGLIIAARAGGAMAARLGTMRVTEQIDALEVMGVDAKNYLVAPRILASLIATPLLCAFLISLLSLAVIVWQFIFYIWMRRSFWRKLNFL